MDSLNPNLLLTPELDDLDFESALKGTGARGTYNPMQFVIRLRDDIHKALNNEVKTSEQIQAFSTFMHENIHWWQHVGSHCGFITSLSYPAIGHLAHQDLKVMLEKNEKYKSIMDFDKLYFAKHNKYDNEEINKILNNWHDVLYAKLFILDNKNIYKIMKDKRFFLSVGHSFHILWSSAINTLATTIDPSYNFLPQVNGWADNFKRVESAGATGFVVDAGLGISSLGTKAIFEGQARFNQLQYLAIASNNKMTYSDFENIGMLNGIYIEAYNLFLKITGIEKPTDLNNPIIGLFLLVCDIAINPTDGFPLNILHFESFIVSSDPGLRFITLCQIIKKDKSKWENSIKDYSNEEYIRLSDELSKSMGCFSPLYGSKIVANWSKENEAIQVLLEEELEMNYKTENLSIRLFFSKYIRFQEDKIKYPCLFCWIGKSMTEERSKDVDFELVEEIFNKHKALFIDDSEGEIKPMLFNNYPEENIKNTFNSFYTYNILYDMIVKWIRESGDFTYDYSWLTTKYSHEEVKNWVRENFKQTFDIYPEELKTTNNS
jgi:hypothetical protein